MTEAGRPAEGVASVARKASELRRLELIVTRRLDGLLRGEFLGRNTGPGSDFSGARRYEPGDDARRIDWNLSARSLDLQLRTTDADRELSTWAVVDRSGSMNFGTADREKADVAFSALAAFGFLTARHGNQFGVIASGEDRVVRLGPGSTRAALMAVMSRYYDLARAVPGVPGRVDLVDALRSLERAHARRGQVIVISDFLDTTDWHKSLTRLGLQHQVLAVQIIDPREFTLPAAGMLTVIDTETGRQMHLQSNSTTLRARYAAAARARHDAIARRIRDAGADHLVLSTEGDWLIDIVRFIVGRRTTQRNRTAARDQFARASRIRSLT